MSESIHRENKNLHNDVVISTRVRLVRNIDGIPFPVRLNTVLKRETAKKVISAVSRSPLSLKIIDMSTLYPYEVISLAERHIITPEFASSADGRILLLSEDERTAVMLNERDHVRIQCTEEGLELDKAYKNALFYDELFDNALHFAFDQKLGYLTQNPGDLGTGMRPSVLMHLPVLSRTGAMAKISATAAKLGIMIRGSYGDAASVKGDLFRVSNSVTMGITEQQALDNLKTIVMQIATRERDAAGAYISEINIKDRINRSAGLIKNAVLLSAEEMTELLSWVRLGALYGVISADPSAISRLFVTMQPASLNVLAGRKLSAAEGDSLRADAVKRIFG